MVLLNEPGARKYLESTDLLPSLEIAIEEMLKKCATPDSKQDPINYLAAYLMRNNPRHNPEAAQKLQELKEAKEEEARLANVEAAKERQLESGEPVKPLVGLQLQLRYAGEETMTIVT